MQKAIGIADVAREAGCSINTVSRALNNMQGVSAVTRARVLAVAERLHYSPSRVARSLLSKAARTLGLVVTDCTNPLYAHIIRAVDDVAFAHDFNVILCNSGRDYEREQQSIRMLLENRVSGMLIAPVQVDSLHIADLTRRQLPFILIGSRSEDPEVYYVTSDNFGGGYKATSLLLDLGHRRIGHLTARHHASNAEDRLAGYRSALEERGAPFDESLVAPCERNVEGGHSGTATLLGQPMRPTAIFAYNDLQAIGAIRAARELGLRVPDDLAVVGYDDIDLAAFSEVPLTTMSQPAYELGRVAASKLFGLMEDTEDTADAAARQIVLPVELVLRRSSGQASSVLTAAPQVGVSPQPHE